MPPSGWFEQLADLLEARAVGMHLQVRLAGVVQRQRAARLHVDVAADDLERADVGGRIRDSRRRSWRCVIARPPTVDGSRVTFAVACTLSGVTPVETFATVASTSSVPPTVPFIAGRPLTTAGSKPANVPVAFTCAVSCCRVPSKASCGIVRRGSSYRAAFRFAVTSSRLARFGVAPAAARDDVAVDGALVAIGRPAPEPGTRSRRAADRGSPRSRPPGTRSPGR